MHLEEIQDMINTLEGCGDGDYVYVRINTELQYIREWYEHDKPLKKVMTIPDSVVLKDDQPNPAILQASNVLSIAIYHLDSQQKWYDIVYTLLENNRSTLTFLQLSLNTQSRQSCCSRMLSIITDTVENGCITDLALPDFPFVQFVGSDGCEDYPSTAVRKTDDTDKLEIINRFKEVICNNTTLKSLTMNVSTTGNTFRRLIYSDDTVVLEHFFSDVLKRNKSIFCLRIIGGINYLGGLQLLSRALSENFSVREFRYIEPHMEPFIKKAVSFKPYISNIKNYLKRNRKLFAEKTRQVLHRNACEDLIKEILEYI
jgi:hypothetical protein